MKKLILVILAFFFFIIIMLPSFISGGATASNNAEVEQVSDEDLSHIVFEDIGLPVACDYIITAYFKDPDYYLMFGFEHNGIDLVQTNCSESEKYILAIEDGKVIYNIFQSGGGGNYVVIYHDSIDLYVGYAHMKNRSYLEVGQEVVKGQVLGLEGQTGVATGNHLHFEVFTDINKQYSTMINPLAFLKLEDKEK